MRFIESWLGISPDGGNGVFEVMLLVLAAGVLTLLARVRAARKRRRFY